MQRELASLLPFLCRVEHNSILTERREPTRAQLAILSISFMNSFAWEQTTTLCAFLLAP